MPQSNLILRYPRDGKRGHHCSGRVLCVTFPYTGRALDSVLMQRLKMLSSNSDRTSMLAHYIISRALPDELGATKLNKVMWYADLEAYRTIGKTISGQSSYRKLQNGPVPNNIQEVLSELRSDGKIVVRHAHTPVGIRHEFIEAESPDVDAFSPQEIDIINQVLNWVRRFSANGISEKSHEDMEHLWEEIGLGDQIPIGAASIISGDISADDLDWAIAGIEKAG